MLTKPIQILIVTYINLTGGIGAIIDLAGSTY